MRRLAWGLASTLALAGCGEAATGAGDLAPGPGDLGASACRYEGTPTELGTIGAPAVELSGLVVSRRDPNMLWGHNDSGDTGRIYSFSTAGGAVASVVDLVDGANAPVSANDWEDIAIAGSGGSSQLYIADTGDNLARESGGAMGRTEIAIYRIPEPDPKAGNAKAIAERFVFTYPDTPHDCESVFVDPEDGALYFITKQDAPAPVYRARPPFVDGAKRTLERVGDIDLIIATGADISADGRRIGVRNYVDVKVFERAPGTSIAEALKGTPLTAPTGDATESLAFAPTGYGFYTAPEGTNPSLYFIACE